MAAQLTIKEGEMSQTCRLVQRTAQQAEDEREVKRKGNVRG